MHLSKARTKNLPKNINPFTLDFVRKEISWYNLYDYDSDNISIKMKPMTGRGDEYLNKAFWTREIDIPVFYIDKKLWMSICPREVQSQYIPIRLANGRVGMAGIGMGYFLLKAMSKRSVLQIDAYEIDIRVIEFFKKAFCKRTGFRKVNFIHGDARKLMQGKSYDMVYIDIYKNLLPEEIPNDIKLFNSKNNITTYRFWGMECVIISAVFEFNMKVELPDNEFWLLNKWIKTPIDNAPDYMKHNLYMPHDKDYVKKVITYMRKWL